MLFGLAEKPLLSYPKADQYFTYGGGNRQGSTPPEVADLIQLPVCGQYLTVGKKRFVFQPCSTVIGQ